MSILSCGRPASSFIRMSDGIETKRTATDPSGLTTYANALQQGVTNELLLAILAGSDEYFSRP